MRNRNYGATIPLDFKRDELIAAIEALRPAAKKADAKALAKHKKDEQAHLAAFKKACREAAGWTYEQAKANRFEPRLNGQRLSYSGPSCPISKESELDRWVALVGRTSQPRFTISARGKYSALYDLLTRDVPSTKGLC